MKEKEKYDIRKYYNKNRMKKKIIRNKSNSAKRKYVLPQQGSVNNWEKLEDVSTQVAGFISSLTGWSKKNKK